MHLLVRRAAAAAPVSRAVHHGLSKRGLSSVVVDRFELLQVERRFDLDDKQLHGAYKALMADAHPDRHGTSAPEERQAAADHASELTDAYSILRAPHLRATHLLELLGAPLTEETHSDVLGPTFLMMVMEVREELEEAGTELPRLQELREENRVRVGDILAELTVAFESAKTSADELENARALTARLQYLQRIEDEIHARTPVA